MSAQIIQAQVVEEGFATKDLKDIFSFVENVESDTYDLLVNRQSKKNITDKEKQVVDAMQGWNYTNKFDELPVSNHTD